jgi:cytochrome c peroxidase
MSPTDIWDQGLIPNGFYPLPHPNHLEGGMVFPKFEINEIQKQAARDLTRFDLDYDIPDYFLPEFPAPTYLTTRPGLGDVAQGRLVTIDNYYELFNGKGLRLLVMPFLQQQFNQTEDRRSETPSRGVACFDCHQSGHTKCGSPPCGRCPPARILPSRRDADHARREHLATIRLTAGAEIGVGGLHRV